MFVALATAITILAKVIRRASATKDQIIVDQQRYILNVNETMALCLLSITDNLTGKKLHTLFPQLIDKYHHSIKHQLNQVIAIEVITNTAFKCS
jgi:hypothetical protein